MAPFQGVTGPWRQRRLLCAASESFLHQPSKVIAHSRSWPPGNVGASMEVLGRVQRVSLELLNIVSCIPALADSKAFLVPFERLVAQVVSEGSII